jgi:RND family efflux transporter MFP subunit
MARYHEAIAQVNVDRAQVETAQINLSYCYMYSPNDGIISRKYVDVGNLVGGAEQTLLANVVTLNPIYIEFSPSVDDFGEILKHRANMPFKAEAILPHGKGLALHGRVDFVNNAADTPTSTILMRATLDNPEKLILPGIYMNVKVILTQSGEAILVPAKVILETQGKRSVYVVNKDNKVEMKTIVTAGQYGDQYLVKSGLKEGDRLIVSGIQKIQPGQEVTVTISGS